LHAKSSTFRAAKLKGFTVCSIETGLAPSVTLWLLCTCHVSDGEGLLGF